MCTITSRLTEPYVLATAVAVLAVLVSTLAMGLFSRSTSFDPRGKFCYVPGGSAGLGKALAEDLVRRGAHVVIVARDASRSADTIAGLKKLAGGDAERKLFAVSADLTSQEASEAALAEACAAFGGRAPDYVFLCAGFSKPQLFVNATAADLKSGLDGVYWVSAWTAHAVVKMMVKQRVKGTITFVSSFVGYAAIAGYSPYAPGKFALRGLADSLRAEMFLHDIKVHLYMPAGILSPGYENEQKTKHAITKKIEESDTPISPEAAVRYLVRGIEKGNYQITNDFMTDMVRVATAGPVPWNGPLDLVYSALSAIVMPIFRQVVDGTVRSSKKSVEEELQAQGFFDN